MEKLIITAAICGAEVSKENNPAVPYTVREIGIEAEKAFLAGASIIHLHVRKDDGTPTQNKHRFKACIEEIKSRVNDIIIMPSTGGAIGMTDQQRLQPIYLEDIEMASLDMGTMNFGGSEIFVNTETTIINFANEIYKRGIKPELECFDKGMIDTALRLSYKGIIQPPMHFNLVFGAKGGINATPKDLVYLTNFLPLDATYTVTGIGQYEMPMAALSIALGGHVRVGIEDNIYISKGVLVESNAQLVEKIVRIATEMGREIASPYDARKILGLKK
jgi:3-keto-5-aminohexanoate cleavage enzyme